MTSSQANKSCPIHITVSILAGDPAIHKNRLTGAGIVA